MSFIIGSGPGAGTPCRLAGEIFATCVHQSTSKSQNILTNISEAEESSSLVFVEERVKLSCPQRHNKCSEEHKTNFVSSSFTFKVLFYSPELCV